MLNLNLKMYTVMVAQVPLGKCMNEVVWYLVFDVTVTGMMSASVLPGISDRRRSMPAVALGSAPVIQLGAAKSLGSVVRALGRFNKLEVGNLNATTMMV